eukprot:753477-Hanusia_phi.AAC.3
MITGCDMSTANSERYLVCKGLLQERPQLIEFLLHINGYLDDDKVRKARGERCGLTAGGKAERKRKPASQPPAPS